MATMALGALALAVAANSQVLEKGRLFAYSTDTITKVGVFDTFNVYLAQDTTMTADVATALVFIVLAGMALLAGILMLRAGVESPRRLAAFFFAVAIGSIYLGLDEMLELNETIGHNLQFLAKLPGISRPDDLDAPSYGIPGLAFLVYFRQIVLSSRRALCLATVSAGLFALATLIDRAGSSGMEEKLEVLAALGFASSFIALVVERLPLKISAAPAA